MGLFRDRPPAPAPPVDVPPVDLVYPSRRLPPAPPILTTLMLDTMWTSLTAVLACDLTSAGRRPMTALRDALRAMPELERLAMRNADPTWEDAIVPADL